MTKGQFDDYRNEANNARNYEVDQKLFKQRISDHWQHRAIHRMSNHDLELFLHTISSPLWRYYVRPRQFLWWCLVGLRLHFHCIRLPQHRRIVVDR
jgi:hypothetical protein